MTRFVSGDVIGLHWGCGPVIADGWTNSDREPHVGQQHTGDLLDGLPYPDRTFRCVVSHHALQMLDRADVIPALLELRRVTRLGGWLRISVPDLEGAIEAYRSEADGYHRATFLRRLFPDDLDHAPGLALNRYLTHYGQRTYWTCDALEAVVRSAGWDVVTNEIGLITGRVVVGQTRSGVERICELDSRPDESLILEAVRR